MLKLTRQYGNREIVYVEYQDGSYDIFALGRVGGGFIAKSTISQIVHTHPEPRWTPSIIDILSAWKASRIVGKAIPYTTLSYDPRSNCVIAYEIKVRPELSLGEINNILKRQRVFEKRTLLALKGYEDISHVSKIQHLKLASERGISITRYVIRL